MSNLEPSDPTQVGRYRLLSRLGEGGMGRVYLARSERGRTVAVKLVHPDLARLPEFRERFRHEVSVSQRVAGQWTTPVLDADTEAEQPWVATGYVPGPSLQSVIAREYGPLPTASLRLLAHGLAQALREVHGVGIVHRDLKPANVLVTIDGPRLIDFGIARAVETTPGSSLTKTGAVVGSPGFLSPEQVRGEPVSAASDVFALGCVLAFAAGGQSPFGTTEGGQHALLFRVAEHPADLATVPEEWHPFLGACLEKEPELRPSVDQLLDGTRPAEGEGDAPWLPATLIASLGRHAAELLAREDPARDTAHTVRPPVPAPASPAARTPPPTGQGTPGTPPPHAGSSSAPSGASGEIPPPPYSGPLTDSLLRQARRGQEVIRLTGWRASSQRFAQLAQHAEYFGYTYESFSYRLSTSPTLVLRRRADSAGGPPTTSLDLLKARITVDGMGAYTRTFTVAACAGAWFLGALVSGGTVPAAFISFIVLGLVAMVAYLTLRGHERTQVLKLTAYGFRRLPDQDARVRYLPAAQNPATPPPSWGTPGSASEPGRYGT